MSNHLKDQTSPYLLQHAENPVDWYPWEEEALAKAKSENKPVLLSIGYSACHWCHVMAHESFEDMETAMLMNKLFVNIKVDREERPDLDKIYQTAHQILTQRPGGWPLTLFLRPDDRIPFFAGTYFPRETRGRIVGFKDLMQHVYNWYLQNPADLARRNDQLGLILGRIAESIPGSAIAALNLTEKATKALKDTFDSKLGGFGSAPKFPHPGDIERLLRNGAGRYGDQDSLDMALFTLEKMALGGINDQLGGGFCRYSVDDRWEIPHFEKMLYDNGPLLALYAQAFTIDQAPLFLHTCIEIANWLMREMQSDEGGYYSSLDADSEGEEGKFYTWTREQVYHHLTPQQFDIFCMRYDLDRPANFEGKWHLHVYQSIEAIAKKSDQTIDTVRQQLQDARLKLFSIRERRSRPGCDEKILTSWNALAIRGMMVAARHCDKPEWAVSAQRALNFIHCKLWQGNRLLATYKDGRAHLNAYLDDYAYLIDALLESLQYQWNNRHLEFACQLADVLLRQFEDRDHGGFYFTSHDHEPLIQRPKPYTDDALPAGNAIAACSLQRLGYLLANTDYLEAAGRCLQAAGAVMQEHSRGCIAMLLALEGHYHPMTTVILRGREETLGQWQKILNRKYRPDCMVFGIPTNTVDLPDNIAVKAAKNSFIAYLCEGTSCRPGYYSIDDLMAALLE